VQRDKLWHSLSAIGLKGKLLKVIKGMYDNVTACVRTKDGKTYSFMCNIGLKQGCLASPKLFSLFINELVKYLHNYITVEQEEFNYSQVMTRYVPLCLPMTWL